MKIKHLLVIHGVIYAFFAIALFFVPDALWPLYGVQVNDQYARFLSQHNSIFLGGVAIIAFFCRNIERPEVVKGLLWTNVLGVVVTLYAGVNGVFVGFGWSDPAFFALMAGLCLWQIVTGGSSLSRDNSAE